MEMAPEKSIQKFIFVCVNKTLLLHMKFLTIDTVNSDVANLGFQDVYSSLIFSIPYSKLSPY